MRLPHRLAAFAGITCLTVAPALAQTAPSMRGPEQQRLNYWVGSWPYVGEDKSSTPPSKIEGSLDCTWLAGEFGLLCKDVTNGGTSLHTWSYSPTRKAYAWYMLQPNGDGTLLEITLDGKRWACDQETTVGGKPAKFHHEWVEESPTSASYRMFRSVAGGPRTLVYDVKMTKQPKT